MENGSALEASKLLFLPRIDEQSLGEALASSAEGTFIGMSKTYGMPFFLNPELLMNPHIFITGMTGSGKTYLTKSLMLKLFVLLQSIVIVVDFTGEYAEFAGLFSAARADAGGIGRLIDEDRSVIAYANLKGAAENRKVRAAVAILKAVTAKMRRRGHSDKNRRVFVILDEAWKLIERSRPLETIIREGRKYRVGMVMASQIIGDIDAPFLSNIATLFIFRVQDKGSLEILQKNYNLREDQVSLMQNLELGSCFVVQVNKHSLREAFTVRRVIGIEAAAPVKVLIGEKMHVEMSLAKFEALVKRICGAENAREIVSIARERGSMRLELLIKELVGNGGDRRLVLSELKLAGVKEEDLADAFAMVMAGKSDEGN